MLRMPTLFLVAVLLVWSSPAATSFADMTCSCGTIVHSNTPTTCPVCSRNLPIQVRPIPIRPIPIRPIRPVGPQDPHGVNDSSGLKLGVVIYNAGGRVVVERVLPNTPADGHFFPNDQLVKGAFRDAQDGQVYSVPIHSPEHLTQLKTMAGPGNRVAMRVARPTGGVRSFFVTFATQGGVVGRQGYSAAAVRSAPGVAAAAPAQTAASVTEDVNGEAAALLDSNAPQAGAPVQNPGVIVNPPVNVPTPAVRPPATGGGDTAEGLLGQ